jgi:hypothetical protein
VLISSISAYQVTVFASTDANWLASQQCGFYGYGGNCVSDTASFLAFVKTQKARLKALRLKASCDDSTPPEPAPALSLALLWALKKRAGRRCGGPLGAATPGCSRRGGWRASARSSARRRRAAVPYLDSSVV